MNTNYTRDSKGFRMEVVDMAGRKAQYCAKVTNLGTGETFENPGWGYWTAVGIVRQMHEEQVSKSRK